MTNTENVVLGSPCDLPPPAVPFCKPKAHVHACAVKNQAGRGKERQHCNRARGPAKSDLCFLVEGEAR